MLNLLFLLWLLLIRYSCQQTIFAVKPTEIILTRFGYCPGIKSELKLHVAMRKVSRNAIAFNVNTTVVHPIGPEIGGSFSISRWGDGGWKHNIISVAYDNVCDACNKYLGELWYIIEDSFIPKIPRGKCPIAPGFYYFENKTLNWGDIEFKIPFVGRFLVTVKMFRSNQLHMCFEYEIIIQHVDIVHKKYKHKGQKIL